MLFGTTSVTALLSAWLLSRRPGAGRILGLLAAAGGLFLGWVITQSSQDLPRILVGIAVAGASAIIVWLLVRWSGPRLG